MSFSSWNDMSVARVSRPFGAPSPPAPTTNGGSASSRFVPGSFQHNSRVAAALLPSLAVLASYGGGMVASALLVGAMGAYVLDAMRYKEGAFMATWLSMGAANLSMVYSLLLLRSEWPLMLSLLIFLLNGVTLFLTGLWATLQFKFIQLQYPAVVMAFEKMLIAGCMPAAAAVQTWGLVAGVGMSNASFFLAALLCALYYLFALPLPSSFHLGAQRRVSVGGAGTKGPPLQDAADGTTCFLMAVLLPAGAYAATHAAALIQWVHLWSLLLLTCGPLLFITCIPDGLWWLGRGRAVAALRRLLLLVSLAGFLAGLEGRVIFYSLHQYIKLTAPWSYIAVTLAMYGVASLALLHFSGALGEDATGTVAGPLLMLSAALATLAAGAPVWVLPAPLMAAGGLAMFYETRSLRDYALFVVGTLLSALWFLWHQYAFLDISLDGMHLHTVSGVALLAIVPALLAPGLLHVGGSKGVLAWLLVMQAGLLCVLEERLYAGDNEELTFGLHSMYPAWLVVATSALGLVAARKLAAADALGEVAAYVLQCGYVAKLSMLIVPEARLLLPTLGVLLAATSPLLLHQRDLQRQRRLQPWQGLGLAAAVVAAVMAARFALFDVVDFLLDRKPSEALMAGLLVLTAAAGCLPMVHRYYAHSAAAKRAVLLAAAFGLLLILLRPPLPMRGGAKCPRLPLGLCPRLWNEEHTPEHEEDDVAIWGDGLRRRTHWPLWLLVGAVSFGLGAMTQPAQGGGPAALRVVQAATAAALVGGYLALEFFPGLQLLQLLVLAGALVVALLLALLQLALPGAAVLMPLLAAAWGAGLPLALLLATVTPLPELGTDAERLYPDSFKEVEEERREAIKSAVLAAYAAEALLLAFALKLRAAAALAVQDSSGGRRAPVVAAALGFDAGALDKAAGFLGQCMPMYLQQPGAGRPPLKGAAGLALQRLEGQGLGWVPTLGNMVTLLCFGLCLALNEEFTGGNEAAILLVAPLLLLLSQDPLLLRGLGDARRYLPPAAAVTLYLAGSAGWRLVDAAFFTEESLASMVAQDLVWVAKNAACLLAALPCQLDLLRYLWSRAPMPTLRLLIPAPLNLAVLLLADLEAVQVAAMCSLGAAALHLVAQQQSRSVGRKLI